MKINVNNANAVWEAFLARWPLDRLNSMLSRHLSGVAG